MNDKSMKERKLKIQIDSQHENGAYSNFFTIISTETEFIFDFGLFVPNRDSIKIESRVILNPRAAKQLMHALAQNIQNYEAKNGEIKLPPPPVRIPGKPPEFSQ